MSPRQRPHLNSTDFSKVLIVIGKFPAVFPMTPAILNCLLQSVGGRDGGRCEADLY